MRVLLGGVHQRSALAAAAALVLGSFLSAVPAQAAPSTPKILLHLMTTTSKNTCTRAQLSDCATAVTNGTSEAAGGVPYFMYLLAATGPLGLDEGDTQEGIAGLQCGIDFDGTEGAGVEMFGWSLCATLEFSSTGWPEDGGGNLITWDSTTKCQREQVGVAGYFYVAAYTPDMFKIIPRPVDGKAQVAKCSAEEINLSLADLGFVAFSAGGTDTGCNPCVQVNGNDTDCSGVPVQRTTWSSIKGLYDGK